MLAQDGPEMPCWEAKGALAGAGSTGIVLRDAQEEREEECSPTAGSCCSLSSDRKLLISLRGKYQMFLRGKKKINK